jgi:hypothetical protein
MARSINNLYWIEIGKLRERERILDIIIEQACDCHKNCDRLDIHLPHLLDRINNV